MSAEKTLVLNDSPKNEQSNTLRLTNAFATGMGEAEPGLIVK